jgi:cytochrome P450
MAKQVSLHMSGKSAENKISDHPTIFHELLQPGALPPSEQTLPHLVNEAQSIVAAGQVTTTHYLNTTAYHILARDEVLEKLQAELKQAMPDGSLPSWHALEQLPYLSAVVLEGYRMSYGPTHRLQRVAPDEDLIYREHVLPAGTPVGMTSIFIHENPGLFPEPKSFRPERWLEPGAKDKLSNYLVNFSKGTRGCLGMHLAQAEIYLTLAAVFGRFEMDIYQTTRADIDVAHDFFNPQPRKGSQGLRVIVR